MPPKINNLIDEYETGGRVRGLAPTQLNALKPVRRGLGHLSPARLQPAVVARYVSERRTGMHTKAHAKLPAADATIRRELGALSAVLNWSHDKRLLKDRPPTIDLPPASPVRNVFLSQEEADQHWLSAKAMIDMGSEHEEAALFACLALDTWARADAIETLPWCRLGVSFKTIDYRDPTRPETSKRRVVVPASTRLQEVLLTSWHNSDKLSDQPVCGPVTQYQWQQLKEAIGMRPEVTRHDLRRTGISLALARGVDPVKVAQMAGDDLTTIMKHYAHFMPNYLEGVVN